MSEYINAYEVVRIINAKPLFAHAHFERLISTINTFNLEISFSFNDFVSLIYNVVKGDSVINGNIRLDAIFDRKNNKIEFISKHVPNKYPSENDYKNGIATCTINYSRHNPGEKIWDKAHRDYIDNIIKEKHVYELIYIDDDSCVTEGSRSNVFFIKNDILYSPLLSQVLPGITRKYIIDTAEKSGFEFKERKISLNDAYLFDSAFISGTSPKILPIAYINDIKQNVNNLRLRELMRNFDNFIENDIKIFEYKSS